MDPSDFISLLAHPEVRLALQAASAPTGGIQNGPSAPTSGIQVGPSAPTSGLQNGPSASASGIQNGPPAHSGGIQTGPSATAGGSQIGTQQTPPPRPSGLESHRVATESPRASDDESVGYSGHARFARDKSPGLNVLVSDNEFGHGRSRSRSPFSHQKYRRGLEKARPRAGSPRMRPQRDFRIRPRSQSLGYRDRSPTASPEPHNRAPSVRGHGTGTGDRSQRRRRRSSSESGSGPGDVVHSRALTGGARRRVSISPRRRRSRSSSTDSGSSSRSCSSCEDFSSSGTDSSPDRDHGDEVFDPSRLGAKDSWHPPAHIAAFLRANARRSLTSKQKAELKKLCPFPEVEEAQCPRLDNFVRDLPSLGFGRKTDKAMAAVQTRVCAAFAPVSAAWAAVDAGRPTKEITQLLQVAVSLVGDAANSISVMRRQRLTGQLPNKCPSSLLREMAPSGNLLFGEDFTRQYKKRTQEIDAFRRSSGSSKPKPAYKDSRPSNFRGHNYYPASAGGRRGGHRSFPRHDNHRREGHFSATASSKNGRGGNRPFRGRGQGH